VTPPSPRDHHPAPQPATGLNHKFKVGVETLFTPFTYAIVGFLKRAEGEDYYDRTTNFNPFALAER